MGVRIDNEVKGPCWVAIRLCLKEDTSLPAPWRMLVMTQTHAACRQSMRLFSESEHNLYIYWVLFLYQLRFQKRTMMGTTVVYWWFVLIRHYCFHGLSCRAHAIIFSVLSMELLLKHKYMTFSLVLLCTIHVHTIIGDRTNKCLTRNGPDESTVAAVCHTGIN